VIESLSQISINEKWQTVTLVTFPSWF